MLLRMELEIKDARIESISPHRRLHGRERSDRDLVLQSTSPLVDNLWSFEGSDSACQLFNVGSQRDGSALSVALCYSFQNRWTRIYLGHIPHFAVKHSNRPSVSAI